MNHRNRSSQLTQFLRLSPAGNKALLCTGLILLLFSFACGGGSTPRNPPVTGNFSNASLNGQYAYSLSGTATPSGGGSFVAYSEAGVFTADGNGHITSGTDDFSQSGAFASNAITGNYSLHNDGTGNINIVFPSGTGSIQFGVSLLNGSQLYLIETDGFATGGGSAEKQDTTAFTTPSGTFVFRVHAQDSTANVGAMTINAGSITGNEDVLASTGLTSPTLSGSVNAPAANGRGTLVLSNSNGITSNFAYYIVNASTMRLLQTDPGVLALGRAEKQSAGPFSAASLTGSFAFGSVGDTALDGVGGARSAGVFTAASGTISTGNYDAVQDGNQTTNVGLSGTYTMSSIGRAAVTLNLQNGITIQDVFWMVNPSRVFFLVNDTSKQEDGTADLQQSTSFSNASLNGQFAFVMDGFDTQSLVDRTGTLQADGNGNLTLNEVLNRQGTISVPGFLPGTYSAAANGRVSANVGSLSSGLVVYMVSSTSGYVLQNDPGTEISGMLGHQ